MGGRGTGATNARERIFRINEFWELILKHSGELKEEIFAKFSYKFGSQRRTLNEYLKVLIFNKKIKEKDGRLYKYR